MELKLNDEQLNARGAAFFMAAMSGVEMTTQDAKVMGENLFDDWPEELKEKTMPYCGLVEKVDKEAASAAKTQSGK